MKRFASIIETVPQPCRIFGTALRPFCLGHHLLFWRLGLPFADNPDADTTLEQFTQAVVICSGDSYEATLAALLDGSWARIYAVWLKGVQPQIKNTSSAALAHFRRHLEDGYRIAPVWRHASKGTISFSTPWEQLLKVRLVMAGFTMNDVMNGYLPGLWYDYFTAMEIKQLETCTKQEDWKRIFYTLQDALADDAAGGAS
jgi:hypothetical protein